MLRSVFKIIILVLIGFDGITQSLEWQSSIIGGTNASIISEIAFDNDSNIYFISNHLALGFNLPLELFKINKNGVLESRRTMFDSIYSSVFGNGIIKIPDEPAFYIFGTARQSPSDFIDFVAKIDTSGNVIWNYDTTYSFLHNNTSVASVVLKDKSVITIGNNGFAITEFDLVARRIDSTGNLLWETNYPINYWQNGQKIIDIYDGSLIVSGGSSGNVALFRIDYEGSLLDTLFISSSSGTERFVKVSLLPNKNLGVGIVSRVGSSTNFGEYFEVDTNLSLIQNWQLEQGIYGRPLVLKDSSIVFNIFAANDSFKVERRTIDLQNVIQSKNYGIVSNQVKFGTNMDINGVDLFLHGYNDSINTNYFWLGKMSNIGEKWLPNPCEFSPPDAKFYYNFDYPLLSVYDSSFSGLKYLDTVYSWQWSSSLGDSSNVDSMLVLLDTSINKTIDIELVISNWYGCTDTVNTTLDFTRTGIQEVNDYSYKIYPNPTNGLITFSLNTAIKNGLQLKLYDVNGKIIDQFEVDGQSHTLDVSNYRDGVYFYEMQFQDQVKRGKIIKE